VNIKSDMPGFGAEASLYKSHGLYHGYSSALTTSNEVQPQFFACFGRAFRRYDRCIDEFGLPVGTCSADLKTELGKCSEF
jgi:hypothetical protein